MEKKSVFISYSWKDGAGFADQLQSQLTDYFEVVRDKDKLKINDDIDEFMARIADCDYIVLILTKEYMKSLNCMYEATTLVSEQDWHEKAFILVINDEIYNDDKKFEIKLFWETSYSLHKAKSDGLASGKAIFAEKLSKHEIIVNNIESFLNSINRLNNPSQITIVNELARKSKEKKLIISTEISNEERVLDYIKQKGIVSRVDIMKSLNISKNAVNRYVSRLISRGLIKAEGMAQTRKYRIIES